MNWRITLAKSAEKQFGRLPTPETQRISQALDAMQANPLGGDVVKLGGMKNAWRRRVGSYRIIFELVAERNIVFIHDIARRTTTTY